MNELEVMSYILCGESSTVIKFDEINAVKKIFFDLYKIDLKDYKQRERLYQRLFVEIEPDNYLFGRSATILTNSNGRVISFRLIVIDLE